MRPYPQHIALLLLAIILGLIAERSIPHSHVQVEGRVVPDFTQSEDTHNEEQESEHLHASHYLGQHLSLDCTTEEIHTLKHEDVLHIVLPEAPIHRDYNVLPKALNTLLRILHHYSSKAPPLSI